MENFIGSKPQVMLENTWAVKSEDGGVLFLEGVILRKVSKILLGADEDGLIPIPVFYDPETKKILRTSVPEPLRDELKDVLFDA